MYCLKWRKNGSRMNAILRLWHYELWNHVVSYVVAQVSEESVAFIVYAELKATGSFNTLVATYETTWCHNSDDCNLKFYRSKNLESHIEYYIH
jgi:hypothetical protein